jgi:hypothetical protein
MHEDAPAADATTQEETDELADQPDPGDYFDKLAAVKDGLIEGIVTSW